MLDLPAVTPGRTAGGLRIEVSGAEEAKQESDKTVPTVKRILWFLVPVDFCGESVEDGRQDKNKPS
eukprot:981626-Amorphochlora_amoeboformis.AAC.1